MYNSYRGGGNGNHRNRFRKSSGNRNQSSQSISHSRYVKKAEFVATDPVAPSTASFQDFAIDTRIKQNIARRGYTTPTPIQESAIPHILEGKDIIGIANTGTGKTAAFLLPLLHKVLLNRKERILIVVPTRELATQIRDELRKFTDTLGIYSAVCIGGSFMGKQMYELRSNPNFVIGTPGRLKDMVERRILNLSLFTNVVLDEVDRMLDMGFIQDMRHLLTLMPSERQSLFFSATMTESIKQLIYSFSHDPILVSVKTHETTHHVEQDVVKVQRGMVKIEVLHDLLLKAEAKKVLIFGRTKHGVERLSYELIERGFKAASIHGDKTQSRRNQAIKQFKDNNIAILVATDVASRGIDIDDITHVINYDEPATYEDYIHRIGRTGRGNKAGTALTFIHA
ncbi:MAG: DEAD/DEAH box helicase [Weeksellaceae bacterium]